MENGKIHTRIILEVVGSPKDHVEKTISMILENIRTNKQWEVIDETMAPAEQIEKLFSTFAEVEINFKSLAQIIGFCFDFMPSSIEIIEPNSLNIENTSATGLINDLIARLHRYDMFLKNLHAENLTLKQEKEKNK